MPRKNNNKPRFEANPDRENYNKKNNRPPICRRCNQEGHTANFCFNEVASDNKTPAPHFPLPVHSVPFIDSHLHCDYICDQSRSPTFGIFLSKTEQPSTLLGGITTLCDSTAICSSLLSQKDDLAANHKGRVFFTIGLHPHNAKYFDDRIAAKMMELMTGDPSFSDSVVGFGEIGLDTDSEKKGGTKFDIQVPVFLQQVTMARSVTPDLPLQLHLRGNKGGVGEFIPILPFDELAAAPAVHFHCFGDDDVEVAKALLKKVPNAVFGFTGLICGGALYYSQRESDEKKNENDDDDKNGNSSDIRYPCVRRFEALLKWIPLDRFVLESDAPYMVPSPVRPPQPANGVLLFGKEKQELQNISATGNNNNNDDDDGENAQENNGGGNKNNNKNKNKGPMIVNHSGHLPFIAAAIADAKGIDIDTVLKHALINTVRVYPKLMKTANAETKLKVNQIVSSSAALAVANNSKVGTTTQDEDSAVGSIKQSKEDSESEKKKKEKEAKDDKEKFPGLDSI